jgi:hypothetical protein
VSGWAFFSSVLSKCFISLSNESAASPLHRPDPTRALRCAFSDSRNPLISVSRVLNRFAAVFRLAGSLTPVSSSLM